VSEVARNWVLVLVKARQLAKTRLAGVLSLEERMALQEAMLADVLATLAEVRGLAGIAICSPDPTHHELARRHGATFIAEPPSVTGLNGAARHGADSLARNLVPGGADFIGLIPGDLPLLKASDVEDAFDTAMALRQAVVIPDQHGRGTNGLFFAADKPPVFSFGPGSFHRHLSGEETPARGVPMLADSFACDIDTPADLAALAASATPGGANTRALIAGLLAVRPQHAEPCEERRRPALRPPLPTNNQLDPFAFSVKAEVIS